MAPSSTTAKSKRTRRVEEIARLFGNAHVFPSKEKWAAQKGLSYRTFGTQAEAIKYALRIAKPNDSTNHKFRKHRRLRHTTTPVQARRAKTSVRAPGAGAHVVLHEKSGKITQIR